MWGEESVELGVFPSEARLLCNQEHKRRVMGTEKSGENKYYFS